MVPSLYTARKGRRGWRATAEMGFLQSRRTVGFRIPLRDTSCTIERLVRKRPAEPEVLTKDDLASQATEHQEWSYRAKLNTQDGSLFVVLIEKVLQRLQACILPNMEVSGTSFRYQRGSVQSESSHRLRSLHTPQQKVPVDVKHCEPRKNTTTSPQDREYEQETLRSIAIATTGFVG
jgi:hypothetical protein